MSVGAGAVRSVIQIAGDVRGGVHVGPGRQIPRQVPAPAREFVDRDPLMSRLAGLVADSAAPPRIVVLTGPPGMGKRAAMRWFAHISRDRFPAGDLYVDCAAYGAGRGPADVGGMVASCLNGLGVTDEHMPRTLTERRNCLRSRTADHPILVVAENATEPAQVRALIPKASGSLVLVSSSADLTELSFDGALFHDLKGLDDDSGLTLFTRIAGVHGTAAVTDLVRFCAGLPLAILTLAARVVHAHGGDPAGSAAELTRELAGELTGELADDARRLAALSLGGRPIVSAAFTAAYERLPDDARHLYRRLGLLPLVDVAPQIAAVCVSRDVAGVRPALAALADARLLERRPGGRFAFHELIRLHAADLARREPLEHREAVLQQVVGHYVTQAAFADRALIRDRTRSAPAPGGAADPFPASDAREKALTWLKAERPNLVAVVRLAFDQGWYEETWRLAESLTAYYLTHRHLADWIATSEPGIQAARRCGQVSAEIRLRTLVSRAYTDRGDLDRAGTETEAAVDLAERRAGPVLRASAWEFRGRYLDRADPEAALAAYERAHDLNAEAGEWRGVGLVLYFAARTHGALGHHEQALEQLARAADLMRWLGDDRMTGRVLIATGETYVRLGRATDARTTLEDAAARLAGQHYEAEARELLADLAETAGDHATAQSHLRAAWHIYHDEGNPRADHVSGRLDPAAPADGQ